MAKVGRTQALFLTVAGVAAAAVARKAIDVVWVAATGRRTPDPEDPDENLAAAASAAAITGGVVALARLGVTRRAARRRAA